MKKIFTDYVKDNVTLNNVLQDSKCYSFSLDDSGSVKCEEKTIVFKYRGQNGWGKIWQKIYTTSDNGMSLGISVIEPGGEMKNIPVATEFCDFLLYGKGTVEIQGLGRFEMEEGDFLNFKKDIVRSSDNLEEDIVVGIWFIKTAPTYKFED